MSIKTDKYKTEKSEYGYRGKFISLIKNDVVFPNKIKGTYEVFQKSDFTLVIPKLNNIFLMVRQYRYPTGRYSLEFPQGGKRGGESFSKCATRELEEETGYKPLKLVPLGEHYPCQSLSKMKCVTYFTNKLSKGKTKLDNSETGIKVCKVSEKRLISFIKKGIITDMPTIVAFNLYTLKYEPDIL
jgi:ADP-ribose pyrophosphatase YjhB (NUDIX family)